MSNLPNDYKAHDAAEWFPMMSDESLDALVIDVKANGLSTPIVLTKDSQVLDGRNRLVACDRAGVDPIFETYEGSDPVGFVITSNIVRRDLSKAQRAIIAAYALPRFEEEARRRRTSGKKLPKGQAGRAADRAGQVFGVNSEYVRMAKLILKKDPEAAKVILNEADSDHTSSLLVAYYRLLPKPKYERASQSEWEATWKDRREQYKDTMLEAEAAMAAPPDLLEQMEMGVLTADEVIEKAYGREALATFFVTTIERIGARTTADLPSDVAFALFNTNRSYGDNELCDPSTIREAGEFLLLVAEEWERLA